MNLPHSPADVIRWLMIQDAVATDPADDDTWPAFESFEPDRPDNCITVYDTTGRDSGRSMVDGELMEHFGFMVRVRAYDKPTGWTKVKAIHLWMQETVSWSSKVTIGAYRYRVPAIAMGPILRVGNESPESKRFVHTINATSAIRLMP